MIPKSVNLRAITSSLTLNNDEHFSIFSFNLTSNGNKFQVLTNSSFSSNTKDATSLQNISTFSSFEGNLFLNIIMFDIPEASIQRCATSCNKVNNCAAFASFEFKYINGANLSDITNPLNSFESILPSLHMLIPKFSAPLIHKFNASSLVLLSF